MAKHCSSCNQSYSDDHDHCPHCGAAAVPTESTAPGSSPDIILGDATLGDGSDSNLVPVITNEGSASDSNVMPASPDDSSVTNLDRVEGSSMDIDLGQDGAIDSSALIVAASDQGSPSDVIDVDWPAVADSSAEHAPLRPPLQKETVASTPAPAKSLPPSPVDDGATDSSSALNLRRQPSVPLDSAAGSSAEIEPEPAAIADLAEPTMIEKNEPSSEVLGGAATAAAAPTEDSSAVDLGGYRGVREGEQEQAGASSSWSSLRESGMPATVDTAGAVVPAGDEAAGHRAKSRGWIVGGVAGLFLGAAASVTLWTFGVEPPQSWRGQVGKQSQQQVTQVQPTSSPQPDKPVTPPERHPAVAEHQPPPIPPAKHSADDAALDRIATHLRSDTDIKKRDPQLKQLEQDIQLVVQVKKQALAELDGVRKVLAEVSGMSAPASLPAAVRDALKKSKTAQAELSEVARVLHLKDATQPVAPAVNKLVAEERSAKTQLAAATSKAKEDSALVRAVVQRLTSAKLLSDGASPDKLLATMDHLLRQGPSPVALTFGGVATGLGEVGGAAASGSSRLVQATANLAVNRWRDSLAAFRQNHTPRVVTTTVLHQPAEEQPALRLPDSLGTYQPESAEKHFSAGFGYFWSGDATQAAREFKVAIQNNREDARYCYFFGLSLLQEQRRTDAVAAFRQGALLEKQGLPDTSAINLILERIQGPTRELLDQYRR